MAGVVRLNFDPRNFSQDRLILAGREASYLVSGKLTPTRDALDAYSNYGKFGELHRAILGIALSKQFLGAVVLCARREDLGGTAKHDPAEAGPVLVPSIGNKSGDGVLKDIPDALQASWVALGLLIDCDVNRAFAHNKAYWHEMWGGSGVCSGKMADPSVRQKAGFAIRQHALSLPKFRRGDEGLPNLIGLA